MMNFSLVVRNVDNISEFQSLTERLEELDLTRYVFETGNFYKNEREAIFCAWEEQAWLNYNGCMIILSEKFPKMTFELTIQEKDNFYKNYYKDGSSETCVGNVVYEKPKKIEWDSLIAF